LEPKNNFHELPLKDIIVGDRFRKNYGDIDQLASSIKDFGLLQPIVIARNGQLLAGGRRFAAAQKLNLPTIPVHFMDEVDDLLKLEIEFEENVKRQDLSWQEKSTLNAAIHELKTKLYGQATTAPTPHAKTSPVESGWSIRRTASLIGANVATVHTDIRMANALRVIPSLYNEPSQINAIRAIDRLEQDIVNELERRKQEKAALAKLESSCICGDSRELLRNLADNSVDCIITDPPYGVSIGTGGPHRPRALFEDTPDSMFALLRDVVPQMRRVLKPTGHLYAFFATRHWSNVIGIYRDCGFLVRDIPCIWVKPGGATGQANWDYNFANAWEPFLYASDDLLRLAFKRKDVFVFSADLGSSRHHPTQKPIDLLRELVQISTQPDQLVLDPFCGAGSTLIAASQLRRRFLGFELDPHYHSVAISLLIAEGKERPYIARNEP